MGKGIKAGEEGWREGVLGGKGNGRAESHQGTLGAGTEHTLCASGECTGVFNTDPCDSCFEDPLREHKQCRVGGESHRPQNLQHQQ